ncbi:leucine-rich repeat domain-containing protein [Butyrivibrio sp. AD3002]|uniref:leucine-rich repeat domain-containing protein n=1 Tax=Butyrivibrio sp. AD3002 TaxID=1280670 RepID=UPI0018CBC9A5|nr:leucine-rich repeat domain-containing protein [Butyrivibrio sp. AD3002]
MKKCLLTAAAVVLLAAAFISKPIKADAMAQARTWNSYLLQTGYFYEQLSPRLKRAYRAYTALMVERQSTFSIQSADINTKLGITDDGELFSGEELGIIAEAVDYDHPALISRINDSHNDIIIDSSAMDDVLGQAAGIAATVSGREDNEKVKAFHDSLVNTITYSSSAPNARNAYGSLIDKKCVCVGYTDALSLLCHMCNIESIPQYGKGFGGEHVWNIVRLQDGEWYEVDCTWDDQGDGNEPWYEYFLKTKTFMDSSYHEHYDGQTVDEFGYYYCLTLPIANGTKYALTSSTPETSSTESSGSATENNGSAANNSTEQQNITELDIATEQARSDTANNANDPSQNTAANSVVNPTAVSDFYSGGHVAVSGETIVVNGTEAAIVKGSGNSIPSYVAVGEYRYEVTEISDGAYSNNSSLKSVTIPKNVRKIGAKAFYNCRNLKKIKFAGKKVNKIGTKAFGNIGKKATASIPKKVYDKYVKLLKKSKPVKGIKYKKR